jgi:hypothetical protein
MFRAIRLPLLALGLVATLTACSSAAGGPGVATLNDPGASASPAASSAPTDPQEAMLAYAACMREQGIDMPDPQVVESEGGGGAGGFSVQIDKDEVGDGRNVDKGKFRSADSTCKHHLANVVGDETNGGMSPEDEEKLLQFARCMREHGIDMPDPQPGGGMILNEDDGDSGPKIDPNDEDFQAAQEACSEFLPGKVNGAGPRVEGGGPGSGGAVVPVEPKK